MPHKDKQVRDEYMRQYSLEHAEEKRERERARYYANRDWYLAYQRRFREQNPELVRARKKDHYKRHAEEIKKKAKDWALNNPSRRQAIESKYRQSQKGIVSVQRRHAKYRATDKGK